MQKKKLAIYIIGAITIAVVSVMAIMTLIVASGSFRMRKTRLIIRTGSDDKEYDGTPLACDEWSLAYGKLAAGHTMEVTVYGEQVRPGSSPNKAEVKITDSDGLDVTGKYELQMELGTLEVTKRKLVIKSASATKIYDGTPLSNERGALANGRITKGHYLKCEDFVSVTEPGVHPNTFSAYILDDSGADVSEGYEISYEFGELIIQYSHIEILSESAEKTYDGTPLTAGGCSIQEGSVYRGHKIEMKTYGTITGVGSCYNNVTATVTDENGNDVTALYDIHCEAGMLSVYPRRLDVRTQNVKRRKNDTPVEHDWDLVSGSLAPGEELQVITIQQRNASSNSFSGDNYIVSVSVTKDGRADDLSGNYQISYQYGRVDITE